MYCYLKLGRDEHGSGANELEHFLLDGDFGQVVVRHLYCQVKGLMVQLKILL